MENIVKAMQHPQTGVPVRSQKLFLTTIPNAFTGQSMLDWMTNKYGIKDRGSFEFRQNRKISPLIWILAFDFFR